MLIKATYRSETRKFAITANDSAYPTWEQLYNQLYRIFPISSNIYLSMMLFSPDASRPSRVLVGREVHTAEQYNSCMAFLPPSHTWKNPLLKFSVSDDTPHKSPMHLHQQQFSSILPPPLIYDMPPTTNSTSMDVDTPQTCSTPLSHYRIMQPQRPHNTHCCGTASGEVSRLIADFKTELDKVLDTRFGYVASPPAVIPPTPESLPPVLQSGMCLSGQFGCTGAGLKCINCDLPRCSECPDKKWAPCSRGSFHLFKPVILATPDETFPGSYTPSYIHSVTTPSPTVQEPALSVHANVLCDQCDATVVGTRHKCLDCADYDLCDGCLASGGAQRHNPFHEFLGMDEPGRIVVHRVYDREDRQPTPVPVVQEAVVTHLASCDMCESAIQGARYKCLECPDYDTCSSCFSITKEQHPHSFVKITKREDFIHNRPTELPRHWANCDGCHNTIYGVRYKCTHPDCPDYDLCGKCEALPFPLHNPRHALLKIRSPDCFIPTTLFKSTTTGGLTPLASVLNVAGPDAIPSIPSTPTHVSLTPLISTTEASERESVPSNPPTASITEPIAKEDVWERFDREAREEADKRRLLKEAHDQQMEELREELSRRTQQERTRLAEEEERKNEPSFSSTPASLTELFQGIQLRPMFSATAISDTAVAGETSVEVPTPASRAKLFQGAQLLPELSAITISNTAVASETFAEDLIPNYIASSTQQTEANKQQLSSKLVDVGSESVSGIFPPGAEFVKSWRMMNDGSAAWPADTHLVVVGCEGPNPPGALERVHVGTVAAGGITEISTGELKAPEVAGSIKLSWQLCDGENHFGDKVSFEIMVAEPTGEEAMGSSSIIIMPASAASTSASRTVMSIPTSRSSLSLESVPSDLSEYADATEASPTGSGGLEYVVLYDSDSD